MKQFRLYILFIFFSYIGLAQNPAQSAGTASFLFLRSGLSARVSGMSESFTAIADDENALYYNPAGLYKLKRGAITLNHTQWFEDIKFDNLTTAYNINKTLGIGFGISHMWMPEIQGKDELGQNTELLSISSTVVQLGIGSVIMGSLYGGFTLKYFSENLASYSASGVALDVGLYVYTALRGLTVGASIQNMGPQTKFYKVEQKLPQTYRGGLAYKLQQIDLRFALDVVKSIDSDYGLNFGAEYTYQNLVTFRLGNKFREQELFIPSYGVGVHFTEDYLLNYTFYSNNDLGSTHRIGFTFNFGSASKYKSLKNNYKYSSGTNHKTNYLLPVPTDLQLNLSGTKLLLKWKKDENVECNVYARYSNSTEWKMLNKKSIKENNIELKKPSIKGMYFFKVSSVKDEKESQFSKEMGINIE